MKKNLPYKSLSIYILILIALFGTFGIAAQVILSRLSDYDKSIAISREAKVSLQERLSVLQGVNPEVARQVSDLSVVLPSQDSSIIVLNQVRVLANEKSVILKNISLLPLSELTENYSSIQLNFIAEGVRENVMSFLADVTKMLPVSHFETLNVTSTTDFTLAQVTLRSFWASLPEQLPSLTETINTLTPEELQVLAELDGYRKPNTDVVTATNSGVVTPKESPFSPPEEKI